MKFACNDIVKVLLPTNYNSGYDYILTEDAEIGDFVCINVRNIKFFGTIIGAGDSNLPREKIRKINYKVQDFKLSESDIKWLFQMANYTMIPLGMVLKLIINVSSVFEEPKQELLYKLGTSENKITEQRQAVIDCFSMNPDESLSINDITSIANVSRSVVNNMIKAGFLEQSLAREIKTFRIPDYSNPTSVELSESQKKAVNEVELFNGFNVHLLDGVTGSGKTEVYFELVEKVLKSKKQVLIMMPEIALTAQFISRFEKRFGDKPTLWHSALSENNRREIWKGANKNEIQIVIGTRSALFLPWKNLGLIVIDEEHDSSYKQEENGIYHARDMAIMRGKLQDFPIILASATPSAETMYNVKIGKYKKSILESRYGNATMPKISIVDIRKEKPEPIDSKKMWLSPILVEKIKENLEANHQIMLFLNRRGFAPITVCPRCGFPIQCDNCSVNMVYHKKKNVLVCHYCGCEKALPKVCEHCGYDEGLINNGVGVEKIKEECELRFPNARTMVISSDQISAPKSMERIIKAIENKEIDILIGTQILAKGHHFPNLTLVGVVDADMGLFNNDFRSSEKTFSNLFQVAGRAGRGEISGEVLIQTIQPEHPVILALQESNRDKLMTNDLEQRHLSKMPPYSRLIAIIIECEDENKLNIFCKKLEQAIPKANDVIIAGPINATIEKIRTWYRMRFLIMGATNLNLQKLASHWLKKVQTPNGIKIKIDVDPQNFM